MKSCIPNMVGHQSISMISPVIKSVPWRLDFWIFSFTFVITSGNFEIGTHTSVLRTCVKKLIKKSIGTFL